MFTQLWLTSCISQPLTSHHLGVLRDAGLVRTEREGRTIRYQIADTPLAWSIVVMVRQQLTIAGGSARRPEPEPGEVAVPHGDHVDYVHDGHRHASHNGHYDDH